MQLYKPKQLITDQQRKITLSQKIKKFFIRRNYRQDFLFSMEELFFTATKDLERRRLNLRAEYYCQLYI